MTAPFVVVPVVEGHGDVAAVAVLLRRMVEKMDPTQPVEVLAPIRGQRSKLVRPEDVGRFLDLAARKLGSREGRRAGPRRCR